VNRKLELLDSIDKKVKWLVLGDSSGNQGVIPSMISDSLEGSSYNLCTYADMTLLDDCWMIDDLIKRGIPPENVIIVRVYDTWYRNVDYTLLSQYPAEWIVLKDIEPIPEIPLEKFKDVYISKFLPIQHQASRVRKLLEKPARFYDELTYIDKTGYNKFIHKSNPSVVESERKYHSWFTKRNKPEFSEHNERAINYLGEISDSLDINIYLANSPLHDQLTEDSIFMDYYNTICEHLSNFAGKHENIYYINNPPFPFPQKLMQTADHVVAEGAELYTGLLINEIKEIEDNISLD
jgi:hypothetical protein